MHRTLPGLIRLSSLAVLYCVVSCAPAFAQRTQLKPPWNIYSPSTDIQLGKQNAQLMMQKLPLCNDPKVDQYLTTLGMKLVSKLDQRGATYPWEFHCVNDKSINAFALPGGFVFVNRGAIEAADNESQLAAVMGHELSHVTLRHGTAQATKAQFAQGAASIFGGIFGGSTGGALLSQGVALGAGGLLLRYSRTDETQADVSGTQVLYDNGYDPRAMSQFFEKLEAESKGKNPPQFLSDHPNPGNRVERVDEEIDKLGGVPTNAKRDTAEFEAIKREVMALPVAKKPAGALPVGDPAQPPAPASSHLADYKGSAFTMSYPDNWGVSESDGGAAFAPKGGVVQGSDGQGALAYGIIVNVRAEHLDSNDSNGLAGATQRLIDDLKKTNPNLKVVQRASSVRLNGQPGMSTYLSNDSPVGGQETDWLITVMRPDGLMSFLCVAPQAKYSDYDKTFSAILDTVRLAK
jgi:beta-barrel assembly-enhancing protease